MKNIAVFYCEDGFSDSHLSFGETTVLSVLSKTVSKVEKISGTVLSLPSSYSGVLEKEAGISIRTGDDILSWKAIAEGTGADHLIKIFADAPFVDSSIIAEMLDLHLKYNAEFTYSENLPSGLSCEIISCELIKSLPEADEKRLPLAHVIRSNINQFDVELYYKGPDIRDKRISFRASNPREKRIMEQLLQRHGSVPSYEQLRELIEKNCDLLYSGPAYLELELSGQADVTTVYSCRHGIKDLRGHMDISLFKKILSEMKSFGLPYSICLGGSGDPLLHPSFYECLELILSQDLVQTVFLETDGIALDENFLLFMQKKNDSRVKIIVDMSGYSSETYSAVHGKDCFVKIFSNITALKGIFGDKSERLYVQLMKIRETESIIDSYYDFWEAQKVQIILQKHNAYLGLIEDRRYYDLTPLDRIPCWHLQRDLFILSDGRVAFCKQDINGTFSSLNCSLLPLKEIWDSRKDLFIHDYHGKRSSNPDCSQCDEWYTFNM